MACRLFGTKPLFEPMLLFYYCQLDRKERFNEILFKIRKF